MKQTSLYALSFTNICKSQKLLNSSFEGIFFTSSSSRVINYKNSWNCVIFAHVSLPCTRHEMYASRKCVFSCFYEIFLDDNNVKQLKNLLEPQTSSKRMFNFPIMFSWKSRWGSCGKSLIEWRYQKAEQLLFISPW